MKKILIAVKKGLQKDREFKIQNFHNDINHKDIPIGSTYRKKESEIIKEGVSNYYTYTNGTLKVGDDTKIEITHITINKNGDDISLKSENNYTKKDNLLNLPTYE